MSKKIHCLLLFLSLSFFPLFADLSLKNLSVEEKVGQLLMVHFHGEEANEEARILIQSTRIGSFIYYNWSNGLHSPEQVNQLSAGLQKLAKQNPHPIPLLIAADQEGGVVARLNHGFTPFPGNKVLGEVGDYQLAEETARAMGRELLAVGVTMNLAPVVDINSNPRNPVIGVRSFGEEPQLVADFGKAVLQGYKKAGVIATLKHFPGYGDISVDPHEKLPKLNKTRNQLELVELFPFYKLSKLTDAIMTAHILVPAFDPENCATLSRKTLSYLRETIGFQGVIVADSLVMDGVLEKCHSVDEAAIRALDAGCDLLILGGKLLDGAHAGFELTIADVQRIHANIVQAIKTGRLSKKRIDQSVQRILRLKKSYPLLQKGDRDALKETVNTTFHRQLAQEAARRAVKTIAREQNCFITDQKKVVVFAPEILRNVLDPAFFKNAKAFKIVFFSSLNPLPLEVEEAKESVKENDLLIICSYNAWKSPMQINLIQNLLDLGKPTALFATRDPLDVTLFPKASLLVRTFSPTLFSIQAACQELEKE
jgi:beta-N-acetylhexosaminidase